MTFRPRYLLLEMTVAARPFIISLFLIIFFNSNDSSGPVGGLFEASVSNGPRLEDPIKLDRSVID